MTWDFQKNKPYPALTLMIWYRTYRIFSLHQHGMLAILTCSTYVVSKFRYPLWHIVAGWLFAGGYSIYAGMIYYLHGDERDAVYGRL